MASGYLTAGRDLDTVFVSGNAGIVTGFIAQGLDLGSRYAARGGSAAAPNTGIVAPGLGDLSELFLWQGAGVPTPPVAPPPPSVFFPTTVLPASSGVLLPATRPRASVTITPDGSYASRSSATDGGSYSAKFTAANVGGVGPFVYRWTKASGSGFISWLTTNSTLSVTTKWERFASLDITETWQVEQTDIGNDGTTSLRAITFELNVVNH